MFGLFKVANVILRGRRGVLIWKCQKPVSLARAPPPPPPATLYSVCFHAFHCAVGVPGSAVAGGAWRWCSAVSVRQTPGLLGKGQKRALMLQMRAGQERPGQQSAPSTSQPSLGLIFLICGARHNFLDHVNFLLPLGAMVQNSFKRFVWEIQCDCIKERTEHIFLNRKIIFSKIPHAFCFGPDSCKALLLNNFYFLTVFVTMGFDLNCQPGDFDVLSGYRKQLSLPLPVHPVPFSSSSSSLSFHACSSQI